MAKSLSGFFKSSDPFKFHGANFFYQTNKCNLDFILNNNP